MVAVVALVEKTLYFDRVKNKFFPAASYINALFLFTISLNGKLGISIGQYAWILNIETMHTLYTDFLNELDYWKQFVRTLGYMKAPAYSKTSLWQTAKRFQVYMVSLMMLTWQDRWFTQGKGRRSPMSPPMSLRAPPPPPDWVRICGLLT